MTSSEPPFFEFNQDGNVVRLEILRRSYPDAFDDSDGNWLDAWLSVSVPGFQASFGLCARSDDLNGFLEELKIVEASNKGQAKYAATEEDLIVSLNAKKTGQLELDGFAKYPMGNGSSLEFRFEVGSALLPPVILQLSAVLEAFPIRGGE